MRRFISALVLVVVCASYGVAQEDKSKPLDTTGTAAGTTLQEGRETGSTGSATSSTQNTQQSTSGATTETQAGTMAAASGANLSSDQVRANIERALQNAPNLSASDVAVNVTSDEVVLKGSVPNQADRATVRRLAEQNANGRKIRDEELIVK